MEWGLEGIWAHALLKVSAWRLRVTNGNSFWRYTYITLGGSIIQRTYKPLFKQLNARTDTHTLTHADTHERIHTREMLF